MKIFWVLWVKWSVLIKINFTCFFLPFFKVVTRKFKITFVAHIFLLVLVCRPFGLILSFFFVCAQSSAMIWLHT